MHLAQICSVLIFILMLFFIMIDKIERHFITIGCGLLTIIIVFGVCMKNYTVMWNIIALNDFITKNFWYQIPGNIQNINIGINWSTIVFIIGMMIMVDGMTKSGFFRWLCIKIAIALRCKPIQIFIVFMIMSAVLSMFIDSITVVMFLTSVTIEFSTLLNFNPIPIILSEIFCANLGGSATMCGDPPNIIIGTSLCLSFFDFIKNTGICASICLICCVILFYFLFKNDILLNSKEKFDISKLPYASSAINNKKNFLISSCIFGLTIVLLITHSVTHITVATIGTIIGGITLITNGKSALDILKKLDYKTPMFFIGLFVVVSGLKETGILEYVADFIGKISGGNVNIMVTIILWSSAIASAFIDNIPFSATMIPIIQSLSSSFAVPINTLAWSLSIGTDLGGSAAPIGASANLVGLAIASKNGYHIKWNKYCVRMIPTTIIVLIISTIYLFVRYLL